jgi:ABC-2 type transport system permease protein
MNQLFKHIQATRQLLWFEWRWLTRTAMLPALAAIFMVIGVYAVICSKGALQQRISAIDSLRQGHYQAYTKMYAQLTADTVTTKAKTDYTLAVDPAIVEYRLYSTAYHPPAVFSLFSTGMSDNIRNYYPVRINAGYLATEEKVANPLLLMTGNFDLAFILIYLIPLAAIGLCYNLLSQEQEQGTLPLMMIQRGDITSAMLIRLFVRHGLLLSLIVLVTLAGLFLAPAGIGWTWKELAAWIFICIAYTAFWMGLIWFIISWKQSSAGNLITLIGMWLLLLIVIPAVLRFTGNDYTNIDTAAVNASRQREIAWETWDLPQQQLLDSFYLRYPQYQNARAYDTSERSLRRVMAYYHLTDVRMGRELEPQEKAYRQQVRHVAATYLANPVVYTQTLLNKIARTDMTDYDYFHRRMTDFRRRWKTYFYDFNFNDRNFDTAAYATIPAYSPAFDPTATVMVRNGIAYLLLLSFCGLTAGIIVFRKKEYNIYDA